MKTDAATTTTQLYSIPGMEPMFKSAKTDVVSHEESKDQPDNMVENEHGITVLGMADSSLDNPLRSLE